MKKHFLIFLAASLALASCAVQKRKYQKGYHISWGRPASKQSEKKHEAPALAKGRPALLESSEPLSAAASPATSKPATSPKPTFYPIPKEEKHKPVVKDEPCDDLLFRDGTELKAKVVEVTEKEVKYKKCEMQDGPLYIVRKAELFMIKYANGTREVFKEAETRAPENTYKPKAKNNLPKRTHPLATASLICGIISLSIYLAIIFGPMAIIFGNMAKKKINEEPDYYKGNGPATTGRIMGYISLGIVLFVAFIVIVTLVL